MTAQQDHFVSKLQQLYLMMEDKIETIVQVEPIVSSLVIKTQDIVLYVKKDNTA